MNEILVLGGTGTTGRRIVERLRAAGHRTRVASRSRGDVIVDLDDSSTWAPALGGTRAAYLLEPEMQATEWGQLRIPRFVEAAVAAGLQRLVLLSAPGVEGNEKHPLWRAEEAVRNSRLEWTIVRPTWFAQNFSEVLWRPGILAGTLALPAGDGATAFADAEDIADVATTALIHDGHNGETYVVTGPRAVTFGEATDLISAAIGRRIRYVDISDEEFIHAQVADGVPADVAKLLAGIYAAIRAGNAAATFDGVPRALGRPARPFESYVSTTATSGAWRTD